MIKYEMQEANPDTLTQAMIIRTNEDGSKSFIPIDEANSDYQAYLNPVEHLTEIIPAQENAPAFPITTEPLTEQTQEGAE